LCFLIFIYFVIKKNNFFFNFCNKKTKKIFFVIKKIFFLITKILFYFLKLKNNLKNKNKIKKVYTHGAHMSIDWSKLMWGAKIATESKLRGSEKSFFFRGPKSQLLKT